MNDQERARDLAVSVVKRSGSQLLELAKEEIKFQLKSSHDILAEADLLSEKIILGEIKKSFPTHGFISEEAGKSAPSDYTWVLDPVDGTINFSRKFEEYCISLALAHKGELQLGIIFQPVLDKLYVAEKGKGAFLNGKRIVVSQETVLERSLLATDNSSKMDSRQGNFSLLSELCTKVRGVRIFGSGALQMALLAEGKIDVYYKTRFNYWDYAAGTLLIQEAGGTVSDFTGATITGESKDVVATNGSLHSEMLRLLR